MKECIMGAEIHYRIDGEGSRKVLLLHGWGSSARVHENMIALLSTKYRVIAPNLPGFGGSDEPPEEWDVDAYVRFTLDFLKNFDCRNVTLIGHSFGGRIIIKLLALGDVLPVEKVILIDSAGVKPVLTSSQKRRTAFIKRGKKLLESDFVSSHFSSVVESLKNHIGSEDYNAASPMMKRVLVRVVGEDLTELMPKNKKPTLLIWGTLDTATPLSDGETMEKLMPESALVKIENAGHFSFLDAPVLVGRIIASFMNIPV